MSIIIIIIIIIIISSSSSSSSRTFSIGIISVIVCVCCYALLLLSVLLCVVLCFRIALFYHCLFYALDLDTRACWLDVVLSLLLVKVLLCCVGLWLLFIVVVVVAIIMIIIIDNLLTLMLADCDPGACAAASADVRSQSNSAGVQWWLCPISLLRLSLPRLLDSNFPGISLWAWELHPLKLRFCLSQTLWNSES